MDCIGGTVFCKLEGLQYVLYRSLRLVNDLSVKYIMKLILPIDLFNDRFQFMHVSLPITWLLAISFTCYE